MLEPLQVDEDGAAAGFGGFATASDLAFLKGRSSVVDSFGLWPVLVQEIRPEEEIHLVGFGDAIGTSGGGGLVTS